MGALAALSILGIVQFMPLSFATLESLSPRSASMYAAAADTIRLAGGTPHFAPRITLAAGETLRVVLLTIAYVSLFFTAASLCGNRARRRLLLGAIVASGIANVALAAIAGPGGLQALLEGSTRFPADEARIHGAFVNPNHFAGYLEICLAAAFAILWAEILTNRQRGAGLDTPQERFEHRMLPLSMKLILWAIPAAGIALSRSRGGMTAAAVATGFAFFAASLHPRAARRRTRFAAAAALAIVGAALLIAITARGGSVVRFMAFDPRDPTSDVRPSIWAASVETWKQFPVAGAGLGSFMEAFRPNQPAEITTSVEQAHNDYLQILVTAGWAGAALVIAAFGSLGFLLFRGWLAQRHREETAVMLAGLAAILSLALHAVTEFNFSIPAIPATLAVLLGVAWAAREISPSPATLG